jgi:hypothetical protein
VAEKVSYKVQSFSKNFKSQLKVNSISFLGRIKNLWPAALFFKLSQSALEH